jgi:hypothetical protein
VWTELTRPLTAAQGERGSAVGVGVEVGAELDQQPYRFDTIGPGRPDERFVEHLLGIVAGLPGWETAVGAVEAAVRAGLWRPNEIADQLKVAESGGDAQVDGFGAERLCDLAVNPEQRQDELGPAVAARRQIGAPAGIEHQLGELAIVAVTRLVELRPAVVVSAIRIRAPLKLPAIREGHCRSSRAEPGDRETGMAARRAARDRSPRPPGTRVRRASVVPGRCASPRRGAEARASSRTRVARRDRAAPRLRSPP